VTKEDEFVRKDGIPYPVEYSVTTMRANDDLVGSVLTFRDVSERKAAAMAEENERLYREARAANQAKDDFLATLSHELRTPMTAILGWNEILDMGDLDNETRDEAIHSIRNSARAQAQLIDDMLDVSRIIMGKFDIDLRPESLPEIVEAAINTIHHQAEAKGVRLSSSIDYRDATVLADQTRLRQVLWNLLSNAVKFTDRGGEAKDLARLDRPSRAHHGLRYRHRHRPRDAQSRVRPPRPDQGRKESRGPGAGPRNRATHRRAPRRDDRGPQRRAGTRIHLHGAAPAVRGDRTGWGEAGGRGLVTRRAGAR
jgi:nitrogen-specific signal transduction histidine kinase